MPTLPFTLPRWAWFAIGGVLLLVAFYIVLDAYGDSRFDAGKDKADAEWKAAEAELLEKAANSRNEADKKAASRAAEHVAKVQDEKEKIDAAVKEGSSPIDVLFGTGD